jgi:hypothetical protein
MSKEVLPTVSTPPPEWVFNRYRQHRQQRLKYKSIVTFTAS